MKIATLIGGALAAAFAFAAPLHARDQLGQRDVLTVDPQRAYIFYRASTNNDVRLMREVTPEERSAWQAARAEAFQRARTRWERRAAEWDRMTPDCRGNGRMTPQCQGRGPRPTEVTEANFDFQAAEMDNFVSVDGGRRFTRDADSATYIIAVEPGTYVVYGPIVGVPTAVNVGFCMCMGSVRFEARAGQIVDLGEIQFPRLAARAGPDERRFGPNRLPAMTIVPASPSMPVPDKLAGMTVVPAQLRAANKMRNYFGVEIDRLPAINGVLAYERDRVIDARTGAPVSDGQ